MAATDQFRRLVLLQSEGVLVVSKSHQILFANPAAERLLRAVHGQLAGQTFPHGLASGIEYLTPDGLTLTLAMDLSEIEWEGAPAQAATSLRCTATSGTARQNGEAKCPALAESIPFIVWIARPDGANICFNRHWTEYTGLPGEACLGEGWLAAFHPDDTAALVENCQRAREAGLALETQARLRGKDGTYRWWFIRRAPQLDAAGNVLHWFGTCTDIDDLKRAEDISQQNAALLQAAGRMAHLGGWTIDLPNRHITWSDEVCAIHELPPGTSPSPAEAIASYAPEWRETMQNAFGACIRQGTGFDLEVEMITAANRRIRVRTLGHAERNAAGEVTRLHGALHDVSSQKDLRLDAIRLATQPESRPDQSGEAFCTLDQAWRFTYLNREAISLLQGDGGELLGKVLWEEFPELLGTAFAAGARRAVAERQQAAFESFYPPLRAWFEVRVFPLEHALAVYFRDVTEWHKSQEQRTLLETCISRLNDMVMITEAEPFDEPGPPIVFVNEAFLRQTGYSREEVLLKSPRFLQGPKTDRPELDRVRKGMQQWKPVRTELINYRKNGEEYWVELELIPVANAAGRFTHWVSVARDITGGRRDREAIAESERRFRAIFDHAAVGICIVSAWGDSARRNSGAGGHGNGRFQRVNQRFCEITGYSAEELLSARCWEDTTRPEDRLMELARLERLLAGTVGSEAWEKRCRRRDGSSVWVSLTLSLKDGSIKDGGGAEANLIVVMEDVSARKQAEEEARAASRTQLEIVELYHEMASLQLDLPALTHLMAKRAMSVTGAEGGVVEAVEGSELVCLAATGTASAQAEQRLQLAGSLSGMVVQTGQALHCADTWTDPRVDAEMCRRSGTRSMIVAPLRTGEKVTGVLKVLYTRPHAFTASDVSALQLLAGSLGEIMQRHLAERQLRAAAEQYRLLFDANPQPMWTVDAETLRFLAVNKAAVKHYGYTVDEFLAMTVGGVIANAVQAPADILPEHVPSQSSSGACIAEPRQHRTKDGSVINVEVSSERIVFNGRQAALVLAQDVTHRLQAERDLVRLYRAQRMLSRCDQALIRAADEEQLLTEICRIAAEIGGYRMAWVGYAKHDAARSILPMAFAGHEDGYLSEVHLSWSETDPSGRGPAGRTLRDGVAKVVEDLSEVAAFSLWSEQAARRGYLGVTCLPLRHGEHPFGVLCLYAGEIRKSSRKTQNEEIDLLQHLADNLAFGIGNIRSQKERLRIETAVSKMAAGVSGGTGAEFFANLARNMAEATGASAALVVCPSTADSANLRTVAVVVDGELKPNFEYPLAGTPCEAVLRQEQSIVPEHASACFPLSASLHEMAAEGYVGRRFDSASGETLGAVCVLFREPLVRAEFVASTLQIFAARAAGEMVRQEADQRIREQASLLDKATDAIIVMGLDFRIRFWNKGAEALLGWTPEEALGQPIQALLWSDPQAFGQAVRCLLEAGTWRGQVDKRRKDGSLLTVEDNWTLVRDESGAPRAILAIKTDMTERLAVAEQLRQSQRLESLGQLTGGVAHDFNNLLTVILGNSEMLLQQLPPGEPLRALAEMTRNAAQRGAELTHRLLAFARRQPLEPRATDPGRLLAGMESLLRRTLHEDIALNLRPAENLWAAMVDPSQLEGALLNLCLNSRDALEGGGALTIEITNVVLDQTYAHRHVGVVPGRYVMLEVSDNGSGIAPENLARVFEPFFTTKQEGKGTGLGLSMVYGFVAQSQGHIRIDSEPAQGTTVKMFLPVADTPVVGIVIAGNGLHKPHSQTGHRGSETVLVVEDNDLVRRFVEAQFESLGYTVITAADAASAMEIIRSNVTIHLLFTDVIMPGNMNGPQLAEAARALRPAVKVLYTSGYSSNLIARRHRIEKGFHMLGKPYRPLELAEKVRAVLSGN